MPATLSRDELARLDALRACAVLDTPPEPAFDDAVKLAAALCATPVALVSLSDENRQWFKARVGLDATEIPRDPAFSDHAILHPDEIMIVPDATLDARFAGNPLVGGAPRFRFYAGAPLLTPQGHVLGTLSVLDREPRTLTPEQKEALAALARMVVAQLELRRVSMALVQTSAQLNALTFMDMLTGLASRHALEQRLEEETARTRRHDGPLSLLLLDVDRFREYGEESGQAAADDALCSIAEILHQDVRQSDLVAHGENGQFAMVLPETPEQGARLLAERYRERIAAAAQSGHPLTVSVGVASWHPRFDRAADFLAAAENAVQVARRKGGNRIESASELAAVDLH